MKTIDAVIVDTYPQNALARLAIEKTVQTGLVRRVHTFSTAPIYPGEEFHSINPIRSTADYSHYMLNIVPYFSNADATLVIQWDGMPHDVGNWDTSFLKYDYIGAPWGDCEESVSVGNGGFSLRSRKLMEALTELKIPCDANREGGEVEDLLICKHFRSRIEDFGCKFAPHALARKFAVENLNQENAFGFHGVFNFPRFLREKELIPLIDEILKRTKRDLFLANFVINCVKYKKLEIYSAILDAIEQLDRKRSIGEMLKTAGLVLPKL
jgi:hypothetical protein